MNTDIATQQKLVRELSPRYLAQETAPVTTMDVLATITKKLAPIEFRKPFARKPNEDDALEECQACLGDGEMWCWEDQEWGECAYCGGKGELPFMPHQVFLTVWRNSHSIETLAVVLPDKVNAFVTTFEPGFPKGSQVELTQEECELARQTALRAEKDAEQQQL